MELFTLTFKRPVLEKRGKRLPAVHRRLIDRILNWVPTSVSGTSHGPAFIRYLYKDQEADAGTVCDALSDLIDWNLVRMQAPDIELYSQESIAAMLELQAEAEKKVTAQ